MTNRRKFLAGLGALASGSAAAVGTGAFTSAATTRTMEVNVVGDASAYLGLTPGDYSRVSNGELVVALGDNDQGGQGVNKDSTYQFRNVFVIENQGGQDDIHVLGQVENLSEDIELINVFADPEASTGNVPGDERLTQGSYVDDLDNPYGSSYAANASSETAVESYPSMGPGEYLVIGMDFIVKGSANFGDYEADLNLAAVEDPENSS